MSKVTAEQLAQAAKCHHDWHIQGMRRQCTKCHMGERIMDMDTAGEAEAAHPSTQDRLPPGVHGEQMIELQIVEREDPVREGSNTGAAWVTRVLQYRDAKYMPWRDVPVITIEDQEAEAQQAADDADVRDYS